VLEDQYKPKTVEEIIEFKRLTLQIKNIKLTCKNDNLEKLEDELYEMARKITQEDNNMKEIKTKGIVDLCFKKRLIEVENEYYEKINKLVEADERVTKLMKSINEANETIKDLYIDDSYDLSIHIDKELYITPETKEQLKSVEEERDAKARKLGDSIREIKTMLLACDTYEQEMEVLKSYRVIGNDGRLSK